MLGNEAAEAAGSAGQGNDPKDLEAVGENIPTGLSMSSPMAQQKLSQMRNSTGFAVTSALAGGGMGAQAAQGSNNPVASFLQGFTAGIQAPAKVYEAKRAQLQSTLDASPLSTVLPELAQRYPVFSGMPAGVALPAIQQIMNDANKIQQAGAMEQAKAQGRRNAEIATPETITTHVNNIKSLGLDVDPSVFKGRTNAEAKEIEDSLRASQKAKYSDIQNLAKDFTSEIKSKSLDDVRVAFQGMNNYMERVKKGEKADPGDMAFKMAFIKVTQPFFARPSMGETEENYGERVKNQVNLIFGNAPLTDEKRREYFREAKARWHEAQRDIVDIHARYKRATDKPMDFERVYPLHTLIDLQSSAPLTEPEEAKPITQPGTAQPSKWVMPL